MGVKQDTRYHNFFVTNQNNCYHNNKTSATLGLSQILFMFHLERYQCFIKWPLMDFIKHKYPVFVIDIAMIEQS